MARKLNKAKKQEGSLLSRQRKKLESQRLDAETARRDANVAQYEKEKAARSKKKYSSDVNPYFNPRSIREEVLSYLLDEGFASDEKSAEAIMGAMSEAWVESIVEGGFPGTPSTPRAGDAGTSGLKMIRTPGGKTGYTNKYSGGEVLPAGTVNKVMSGDLMVKRQNKSDTKTA